ncbi:Tyrosine-tRNA ligase, mitochondrial [Smittium culicis]|uniref:Tyrosine--tRNA ligase n=1 Tax=Smittium culicis TaxID=133412 RepID=A0A1R1YLE2_9FUNG|nr:Tyrosine-tRNA ligase, mitochondrial [Smittium culicis]
MFRPNLFFKLPALNRFYSKNVISVLRERKLIDNITSKDLEKKCQTPITVYLGVDPTAPSMHLGNLIAIVNLIHFHLAGHQVISLVGGATGSIGDPSGRKSERAIIEQEKLNLNIQKLQNQMKLLFNSAAKYSQKYNDSSASSSKNCNIKPPLFLNNNDWYSDMNILHFLRTVGRVSRVKQMLARESVKARMLPEEIGISFTEFTYQLLQAYDFYYLNQNHNCSLQIGGSDQWGNITAGIDLINKLNNLESSVQKNQINPESFSPDPASVSTNSDQTGVYGLTIPLLLSSTGEKYGKSAGNAVWLDPNLTSPYQLYQHFMKTPDADVEKLLLYFTLVPKQKILETMAEHTIKPERKVAQTLLAEEVTELVHGSESVRKAQLVTNYLFGSNETQSSNKDSKTLDFPSDYLISALKGDPILVNISHSQLTSSKITDLSVISKACSSKSEASRLIKNGGLYWNNSKVLDNKWSPDPNSDFLGDPKISILRVGKSKFFVLNLV